MYYLYSNNIYLLIQFIYFVIIFININVYQNIVRFAILIIVTKEVKPN